MLGSAGRHAEAVEVLTAALRLRPDYAEGHANLGVALEHLGQLAEAEAAHREAIRLRPGFAEAHCNLGNVLRKRALSQNLLGQRRAGNGSSASLSLLNDSLRGVASSLRLASGPFPAHRPPQEVLRQSLRRNEEALAEYRRAASLGHAQAYRNLAGALGGLGRTEEATACYRRLVELRPDDPAAGSEFLVSLHHLDSVTPDQMFEEHLRWARRFAEPLYPAADRHAGRRGGPGSGAGGRLRIGYVSPDFREYPAAHFFLPVLENHDRAKFEVFCYSDAARPDAMTQRLRAMAENWREIAGLPDQDVDALIRRDRIDILVDLAGHMFNPRLLLFARKPAPVQATYIGYPNTTGLRTMDFRITDAWHDGHDEPRPSGSGRIHRLAHARGSVGIGPRCGPYAEARAPLQCRRCPHRRTRRPKPPVRAPAALHSPDLLPLTLLAATGIGHTGTDAFHTERLVRLPRCCWAYAPGDDLPAAAPLPAEATGQITFGVMNRLVKVTPRMIELWSRILAAVAGSRLLVLVPQGCEADPSVSKLFTDLRVDTKRLHLVPRRQRREYLELFNQIDIALDTSPYAGMTTTCDALWMGVPTVTLAGHTHASRTGVSLLNAVGLPELIARTQQEYIGAATALAADLPKLAALRAGLRERVARSPLADGAGLAAAIEAAYREMWGDQAWTRET